MKPLTPADMELLEFERTPWKYLAAKEEAVRQRFGMNHAKPLVRYFQRLNHVISMPAAEIYDPELVHRLRRLRDEREATRYLPRSSA